MARASCLTLLVQTARLPAPFARAMAGSSSEARIAIIAMVTRSSMRVNPRLLNASFIKGHLWPSIKRVEALRCGGNFRLDGFDAAIGIGNDPALIVAGGDLVERPVPTGGPGGADLVSQLIPVRGWIFQFVEHQLVGKHDLLRRIFKSRRTKPVKNTHIPAIGNGAG